MKHAKIYYFLILSLFACTTETDKTTELFYPTCPIDLKTSRPVKMSSVFEKIEYLRLGDPSNGKDMAFKRIRKLAIDDKYIYVFDKDGPFAESFIHIYSRAGSYLRSINGQIQPNSFQSAIDFNVYNQTIEILTYGNKSLLAFDVSGNYLRTLKMPDNYFTFLRYDKDHIFLGSDGQIIPSAVENAVCIFNEKNNTTKYSVATFLDDKYRLGNEERKFYQYGSQVYYHRAFDPKIYRATTESVYPILELDFGELWLEDNEFQSYKEAIQARNDGKGTYHWNFLTALGQNQLLVNLYLDGALHWIHIDQSSNQSKSFYIQENDLDQSPILKNIIAFIPPNIFVGTYNYYYLYEHYTNENLEQQTADNYLDFLSNSNPNDNSILFFYYLDLDKLEKL